MSERKVLVVTEEVIGKLSKQYNIEVNASGWEYSSPNGMIKQRLELGGLNSYGKPSYISINTSDIEEYPKVSEDFDDYYSFQKAFQTETVEEFVERVIKGNTKGDV